ncbi:MAG: hypothetical protein ACK4MQ_12535 [Hyphomonas sp.]
MSVSQEREQPPRTPGQRPGMLSAVQTWGLYPLVMSLASDFLSPLGPVSPGIFILFLLLAGAGFYLSRNKPATLPWSAQAMKFSLVGAAVFAVVIGLQLTTAKQDADGNNIGVVASYVPGVAAVQSAVLPVEAEPKDEYEAAMRAALRAREDSDRRDFARRALASEDAAFRQTAAERFYLSGQPVLRRQAAITLIETRGRVAMPIVVVEAEDNHPDAVTRLMGKSITVSRVERETGALSASILGYGSSGTVGQTGVNFSISNFGVLDLKFTDEFTLRGTYRETSGASAEVEVLLN